MNTKGFGSFTESFISRPQQRGRIDKDGGNQMSVGKTDAEVVQTTSFNHSPHLVQLRYSHLGQKIQQRKRLGAFVERSQSKFRNDKRMDDDIPQAEMSAHLVVSCTEVVDPDRRIS
jgi:hypothetical protein